MKNSFRSISEELFLLHEEISYKWPAVTRMAVALYDNDTDLLHTFLQSNSANKTLNHYSFPLSESNSLNELSQSEGFRYIEDLTSLKDSHNHHSIFISENFKSSLTFPLYWADQFLGFVFFDAIEKAYFSNAAIKDLKVYGKVIENLVQAEILPIKMLVSMLNVTHQITHSRDSETGCHIVRMGHYMELLAVEMADKFGFSDEEIEYIWLYAPMHDIGKIVIPDRVLQKKGPLNEKERKIIETHVDEGLAIIDKILSQFQLKSMYHIDLLKHIIAHHHERWDGSGYPKGLTGEQIPPIGRIAAIADVFDALSAKRVYRDALPLDEVFAYMEKNAGILFDPEAVQKFIKLKPQITAIHNQYLDID